MGCTSVPAAASAWLASARRAAVPASRDGVSSGSDRSRSAVLTPAKSPNFQSHGAGASKNRQRPRRRKWERFLLDNWIRRICSTRYGRSWRRYQSGIVRRASSRSLYEHARLGQPHVLPRHACRLARRRGRRTVRGHERRTTDLHWASRGVRTPGRPQPAGAARHPRGDMRPPPCRSDDGRRPDRTARAPTRRCFAGSCAPA